MKAVNEDEFTVSVEMDLWTAQQDDEMGIAVMLTPRGGGKPVVHFLPARNAVDFATTVMAEVWRMEGEAEVA